MSPLNRRDFLCASAGAAAAFWATDAIKSRADEKPGGKRKKIRLGMIRADTHGYYYAVMLDKCDPLLLQKNDYVVHHYMSNIYRPDVITAPWVDGFEIVKIYDYDAKKPRAIEHAESLQRSGVFSLLGPTLSGHFSVCFWRQIFTAAVIVLVRPPPRQCGLAAEGASPLERRGSAFFHDTLLGVAHDGLGRIFRSEIRAESRLRRENPVCQSMARRKSGSKSPRRGGKTPGKIWLLAGWCFDSLIWLA